MNRFNVNDNLSPLFDNHLDGKLFSRQTKNMEKIKKVMVYLESLGITTQDIGIPTSFVDSGQQWDGR